MNRRVANPGSAQPMAGVLDALDFAAVKHRDQRRKNEDASPYINHPIAVAKIVCAEAGIDDPIVLCAALLHDTIEDTRTTLSELRDRFGPAIADVVQEVTDDKTLPKLERKRAQIEHASTLSTRAKLVKLADKIANLRDVAYDPPREWSLERRREYFDWAKAVVDGLRGCSSVLERLFDEAYEARP
jgi:GTP diphosphokinase / guanosine-3',5'-bis(diphosphate) 3'-diphosphatase